MMGYLNSLVYTGGLTLCLSLIFHKDIHLMKKILFVLFYALLHFFLISEGSSDINKYILLFISVILMDWLMLCWLQGKIEMWVLFYTSFYFVFYLIGQNIIMYIIPKMVDSLIIHLIVNSLVVGIFIVFHKIKLLPERVMIQQHAHLFNVVNMLILLIIMIFYSFQMTYMRNEYVIIIDGMIIVLWQSLLYVMNQTFVLSKEKAEYMLMDLYNQNVEQYIHYYLQDQETLAKIKHDFKNHLMVLQRLNDFDQVHEYIEEIIGDIQQVHSHHSYGNIYVDACIDTKVKEYENVQFLLNIQIDDLHMNGKDLCSLLFNLLDNAANAANQCQGEVDVNMLYNEGNLVINIVDDCLEEPDFVSHKENHGYGMKIIQSIVDKYNGAIEYRFDKQKVYVDLCIQV